MLDAYQSVKAATWKSCKQIHLIGFIWNGRIAGLGAVCLVVGCGWVCRADGVHWPSLCWGGFNTLCEVKLPAPPLLLSTATPGFSFLACNQPGSGCFPEGTYSRCLDLFGGWRGLPVVLAGVSGLGGLSQLALAQISWKQHRRPLPPPQLTCMWLTSPLLHLNCTYNYPCFTCIDLVSPASLLSSPVCGSSHLNLICTYHYLTWASLSCTCH